jgi:cell division septal protein FtsQ
MYKVIYPKNSKVLRRKKQILIWKTIGIIVFVVVIVGAVSFLANSKYITIQNVNIQGNVVVGMKEIADIVEKENGGSFLAIFPKKNILLYPKSSIKKDILTAYPRVESVTIGLSGLTNLNITIKEREPFALWCRTPEEITATVSSETEGTLLVSKSKTEKAIVEKTKSVAVSKAEKASISKTPKPLSVKDDCYFLDKTGRIFAKAPDVPSGAYVVYFGDIKDINPVDKDFMAGGRFVVINSLIAKFAERKLIIEKMIVTDDGDQEFYIENNGKIILSGRQDEQKVIEKLDTVSDLFSTTTGTSSSMKKIESVDLRYANKVFYK